MTNHEEHFTELREAASGSDEKQNLFELYNKMVDIEQRRVGQEAQLGKLNNELNELENAEENPSQDLEPARKHLDNAKTHLDSLGSSMDQLADTTKKIGFGTKTESDGETITMVFGPDARAVDTVSNLSKQADEELQKADSSLKKALSNRPTPETTAENKLLDAINREMPGEMPDKNPQNEPEEPSPQSPTPFKNKLERE